MSARTTGACRSTSTRSTSPRARRRPWTAGSTLVSSSGRPTKRSFFAPTPPTGLPHGYAPFGSPQSFAAFQETEKLAIPETSLLVDDAGREFLVEDPDTHWARNLRDYNRFKAQLLRFEDAIHHEVG